MSVKIKSTNFVFLAILIFFSLNTLVKSQSLITMHNSLACVVLGEKVNVRQSPTVSSPVVTVVTENSFITLLEWGIQEETIGIFKDKWVKIRTQQGKIGYIFGAFLFEMKNLYREFSAIDFGGGRSLTFSLTGNYQIDGMHDIGKSLEIGTFRVNGREIILQAKTIKITSHQNNVTQESICSTKKVYYISKFRTKNYLLDSRLTVDKTEEYLSRILQREGMIRGFYSN